MPHHRSITSLILTALFASAAHAQPAGNSREPSTRASVHADYSGSWDTTFGPLTCRQTGDRVEGTYGAANTIDGRVTGRRLRFRYTEPNARGEGWFELAATDKSFEGKWRVDGESAWKDWTGTLAAAAAAATDRFDGLWTTSYGAMRLATHGEEIRGTYSYAGGSRIWGQLKNGKFDFHYDQPDGEKGTGQFQLAADGMSFSGPWKSGQGAGGQWTAKRMVAQPGRVWLVVLEAHWETGLAAPEYSYGAMLRSFFSRLPAVQVRHRFVNDKADLRRWCAELAYFPEPVVLYISTHGTTQGVSLGGEKVDGAGLIECLRDVGPLRLLHFGSCMVLGGDVPRRIAEARPPSERFPISGFTLTADWGGSAIVDFAYLELVLGRNMPPAEAVSQTRTLVKFATENMAGPIPGSGLKVYVAPQIPRDGQAAGTRKTTATEVGKNP